MLTLNCDVIADQYQQPVRIAEAGGVGGCGNQS